MTGFECVKPILRIMTYSHTRQDEPEEQGARSDWPAEILGVVLRANVERMICSVAVQMILISRDAKTY